MTTLEELELPVRVYNVLKRAGIDTVEQLEKMTDKDLLKIRNLSHKGTNEVLDKLRTWKERGAKNG